MYVSPTPNILIVTLRQDVDRMNSVNTGQIRERVALSSTEAHCCKRDIQEKELGEIRRSNIEFDLKVFFFFFFFILARKITVEKTTT